MEVLVALVEDSEGAMEAVEEFMKVWLYLLEDMVEVLPVSEAVSPMEAYPLL